MNNPIPRGLWEKCISGQRVDLFSEYDSAKAYSLHDLVYYAKYGDMYCILVQEGQALFLIKGKLKYLSSANSTFSRIEDYDLLYSFHQKRLTEINKE
jgi:hypothetical protein